MGRGVSVLLVTAAFACLFAAVLLAALARDTLAWRSAIHRGDTQFARDAASARWQASTWLPGDPSRSLLGLDDSLLARKAIRAYVVAIHTGVGFDNGETRDRVRSAAEIALAESAARGSSPASSQASNLLGALVASGGQVVGGVTADDRALDAFDAAIRRDTSNLDAKYNLELVLRRTAAHGTRQGQGNGTGTSGHGQHGAGAGTPGRGY